MLATPRRAVIMLSWMVPVTVVALSLLAAPYFPQEWWLPVPPPQAAPANAESEPLQRSVATVAEAKAEETLADIQSDDLGMLLLVDEPDNHPRLYWAPWPEQAESEIPAVRLTLLRRYDIGRPWRDFFPIDSLDDSPGTAAPSDSEADSPTTSSPPSLPTSSPATPIETAFVPPSPFVLPGQDSTPPGTQAPAPSDTPEQGQPQPTVIAEPPPLLVLAALLPVAWSARRRHLQKS